jgi:hypothetical protein
MYKFKSRATGDLIMLEANGRQVLRIIGKDLADSAAKGILLPQDMPDAIAALQAAVAQDEAAREQLVREALEKGDVPPKPEGITLRQRVVPLVEMLQRCIKADKEMVWGV